MHSSVVFTGIYGYAIGIFWLLCGVLFITINLCCQCDEGRRKKINLLCNYKDYLSPIHMVIILLLFAIVTSGLTIAISAKFNNEARTSVNIIIKTANDAAEIIHNATGALKDIQEDLVEASVGVEASGNLYSTADKFDATAENIIKKARKNRHLINKAFKVVFVITIVIISLNLIAATTLSVSGLLKFWRVLYLLMVICWLMIVIGWLLFGVYLFLENFSNDACTSLFNFEENPYNNSLSYIIPCDELLSAKSFISEVGGGIYNLVNEVNSNISNLQGTFPNLVYLCNPFTAPPQYLYQPENCPPSSIQIGDIPKVLKPYTCFDDGGEKCNNQEFISSSEYEVVESYTSSIQNLLNVYPSMEKLIGCELVKDAFSEVLLKHCKPLRKLAKTVWLGILLLELIIMYSVVLWMRIKVVHEHSYHVSHGQG
uniref:Uncharacterized protein LOC101502998 n=2 Tax=Cicer arietinum TaxID=3827 RepID=A0A3Q7YC64_CICAR|nr:uncharacterized protein LOC101502998 [Cicer arietinum]